MNIVHTESSCGWGGQEIRILEESKGLLERGHNITIVCSEKSNIYKRRNDYDIPIVALSIHKKSLKGILALRGWISVNDIDIINTHSSTDSWISAIACLSLASPPPLIRTRHISSSIPNNFASRWLYKRSCKHIVTTGIKLREQIIQQLDISPDKISSIPTGIDPEKFNPGSKLDARQKVGLAPEKKYIGIIATLRSWKGHQYLIESLLNKEIEDYSLVIVGDGPRRERIKQQVIDLKLQDRVHIVGSKNNTAEWFQSLDIFCLPSYANEGVPQAIMQAALSKIPVITCDSGSISELINNNETGIMVPTKSSHGIAEAVIKLDNSPSLKKKITENAYQKALLNYNYNKMVDDMISLFTKTINI